MLGETQVVTVVNKLGKPEGGNASWATVALKNLTWPGAITVANVLFSKEVY